MVMDAVFRGHHPSLSSEVDKLPQSHAELRSYGHGRGVYSRNTIEMESAYDETKVSARAYQLGVL
jgi:hypothetical protein